MIPWTEKVVAPVAVVAIHQLGAAIDRMRATPPTSMWNEVATYATYAPAVITLGGELLMPNQTPKFVKLMTAPAVTIAADKLGGLLVDWIIKAKATPAGAQSEAVREAQRILAQARAGHAGKRAEQPITLEEKLIV